MPKPCPFCGSTDLEWDFISRAIRCRTCHALGPRAGTMGRPEVAWNRRMVSDKKPPKSKEEDK